MKATGKGLGGGRDESETDSNENILIFLFFFALPNFGSEIEIVAGSDDELIENILHFPAGPVKYATLLQLLWLP